MTNIITTPSRALQVILSDDSDIPTPYLVTKGRTTKDTVGELIDDDAKFISDGVNIGDIVYIVEPPYSLTIVGITQTVLTFDVDPTIGVNTEYSIYQQSPVTGSQNQGCLLYVSCAAGEGALQVTTAGNDIVFFDNLSSGVLPVRVKKAWRENRGINGPIVALW